MDLDKFDYILAVVETQNLTRAAKLLYISQPTLTNYINKLEEELGVKLFDRSVSPIRITKAGTLYVQEMKAIRESSVLLAAQLRQMGSTKPTLNIGIGTSRGRRWLPRLLPRFCRNHPDVTICIQQTEDDRLERAIRGRSLDVGFGVFSGIYPELTYTPVSAETILVAVPRRFPCVSGVPLWEGTAEKPYRIDGAALSGIPFFLPRSTSDFYRTISSQIERYKLRPSVTHTHGSLDTAYYLAAEGLGAVFITDDFLQRKEERSVPGLVYCTLSDPPLKRYSTACCRTDCAREGLVQELIAIAKEEFSGQLGR